MPASLIKLYLGLTVSTDVEPTPNRWKSTFADGTYNAAESRYEFVVADFEDDNGDPPAAFPDMTDGYYNLYINGMLQQGGLSSIIDDGGVDMLIIEIPEYAAEDLATPLVIEFATFAATSTPASDVVDAPQV